MTNTSADAVLATQAWMDEVQVITDIADIPSVDLDAARALVGSRGMAVILGLMIGSRQGFYVQLGNTGLADPAGIARASVIQGTIKGIDLLPSTLLELISPSQPPSQEQTS